MNKINITANIDFNDSIFKSFDFSNVNNLIVYLDSWDENIIKITFKNPTQFIFQMGDLGGFLFELENSLPLETNSDKDNFKQVKSYQIEDINNFPYIKVISESVDVVKIQSVDFKDKA